MGTAVSLGLNGGGLFLSPKRREYMKLLNYNMGGKGERKKKLGLSRGKDIIFTIFRFSSTQYSLLAIEKD